MTRVNIPSQTHKQNDSGVAEKRKRKAQGHTDTATRGRSGEREREREKKVVTVAELGEELSERHAEGIHTYRYTSNTLRSELRQSSSRRERQRIEIVRSSAERSTMLGEVSMLCGTEKLLQEAQDIEITCKG